MKNKKQKPSKDDLDLVAAALGLRSSAWAQASAHLTEPQFNFAINGERVGMQEKYSDVLVTYHDGTNEDSISLPAENEGDWDIVWRLELRKRFSREYVEKCELVAVRYPDGQLVEYQE